MSSGARKEVYLSVSDTLETGNTENCILQDGRLMARQGVFARAEEWIFDNHSNLAAEMSLIVTECFLYVDGKYCRVAVNVADNLMGNVEYGMKLVFADGSVKEIGRIVFSRSSADSFGLPDSFTVFGGAAIRGSGIYFISRQIYSGQEDFVRILELSSDMTNWYPVSESNIYSPVILANGRGDSYHLAAPQGDSLKLRAPVSPQVRNLLGGGFRCFFTADSASSAFSLPVEGLDNGAIYGTYAADKNYSFKIEAGSTVSSEVKIGEVSVKMECDRVRGKILFKRSDGSAFAPQYTGLYNNLEIQAEKFFSEDRIKIAAMSASVMVGGDSGRGQSKVSVFYKNRISPAQVAFNSPEHPLYFPANALQTLGEPQLSVISMVMKDRSLVAFKENEVYAAEIKGFDEGLVIAPSNQGEKASNEEFAVSFLRVAALEAPPLENTVTILGRDIFYTSKRGDIMRIYGSGTSIYNTENVGAVMDFASSDTFAVSEKGKYILVNGEKCLAVEKCGDRAVFFVWNLPERVINGFTYLDKAVLFAALSEGDTYYVYPVMFSGDEDCKMKREGGMHLEKNPFYAQYSPKTVKASSKNCRIIAVIPEGQFTSVDEILRDRTLRPLVRRGGSKVLYRGFSADATAPRFRFSSDFFIDGIRVLYRSLSKF